MRNLSFCGNAATACAILAQPIRSGPFGRLIIASTRCKYAARVGRLRSIIRSVTSTKDCFMAYIFSRMWESAGDCKITIPRLSLIEAKPSNLTL